jgi:hypothetical protein
MSETIEKAPKHAYRLPPCPSYDIEGMESWLSDMAAEGLLLSRDSFFAGFAFFDKSEPRKVRYRLEAAPKHAGIWSIYGDEPDEEAVKLNKTYGWEYIARRGQFFVYWSETEDTRELNTEPEVQAIAVNLVRKRERSAVITSLLWLILYPVIRLRGSLLLTALHTKTWIILFGVALSLWLFIGSVARAVLLGRLRKKLSSGETPNHCKNWRRRAAIYRIGKIARIFLIALWVCLLLHLWIVSTDDEKPLAEYTGELPFATIADLAPEGKFSFDSFGRFNTIEIHSDWLAPVVITLQESAHVELPGGRFLSGILSVDYYETGSPLIAREVAREHHLGDRFSKDYKELQLPELDVDYAVAYMSRYSIGPTLILQEGNKVMHLTFFQSSSSYEVDFEDWVSVFVQSMK